MDQFFPETILVVLAADLRKTADGTIVCGENTKANCDEAIAFARHVPKPLILLTATKAGKQFDHVMLGRVMQEYVDAEAPDIPTDFHEARLFNTYGEVSAAVDYVACHYPDAKIVFVVEEHRKRRVGLLADAVMHFSNTGMFLLRNKNPSFYSVHTHQMPAPWWRKIHRALYERLAYHENRHMLKRRWLYTGTLST